MPFKASDTYALRKRSGAEVEWDCLGSACGSMRYFHQDFAERNREMAIHDSGPTGRDNTAANQTSARDAADAGARVSRLGFADDPQILATSIRAT
jgi:hypothetical protein